MAQSLAALMLSAATRSPYRQQSIHCNLERKWTGANMVAGGTSTLTITITNPAGGTALTGLTSLMIYPQPEPD